MIQVQIQSLSFDEGVGASFDFKILLHNLKYKIKVLILSIRKWLGMIPLTLKKVLMQELRHDQ